MSLDQACRFKLDLQTSPYFTFHFDTVMLGIVEESGKDGVDRVFWLRGQVYAERV